MFNFAPSNFTTDVTGKEENILLAAEKLFADKGFDATSTREISAAANVNVSMISYYFGSKEQLLEKLFEYRMREGNDFSREVLEREDATEWEKILDIVSLYIGRVARLKNFYSVMQTEQITNKNKSIGEFMKTSKMGYLKTYETLLDSGFSKGLFTKKPKVELLHATIIGTVFYAFNGMPLYREFAGSTLSEDDFRTDFFKELQLHIQLILKNLLGYEEK